ncbi:C40 family peptidase [Kitasatospora sp. NPDC093102]|uniref:C40 family peptidase n=1 Tax=Kitasatospora sp. NPDC093102 TaxID=3155069 RepID=UPI003443723C
MALAQVGKPYVWGAVGPESFDCSGLVQYSYRAAGRSLPRTTWEQIAAAHRVPIGQLQPGDLVFYRKADHVALYIGNGQIVSAPHTGALVKVSAVDSMPIYAAARP